VMASVGPKPGRTPGRKRRRRAIPAAATDIYLPAA
jgi:hypothetical protein